MKTSYLLISFLSVSCHMQQCDTFVYVARQRREGNKFLASVEILIVGLCIAVDNIRAFVSFSTARGGKSPKAKSKYCSQFQFSWFLLPSVISLSPIPLICTNIVAQQLEIKISLLLYNTKICLYLLFKTLNCANRFFSCHLKSYAQISEKINFSDIICIHSCA